MRKTILFIAMSLDGYIADSQGGIDWLQDIGQAGDVMQTYRRFYAGIDTILMGYRTYHQIAHELSPTSWMYPEKTTYVVTHRKCKQQKTIVFTDEDPCALIRKLKQEAGKDIWICGGANLVSQLQASALIDRYHISILPILLGEGISLFPVTAPSCSLQLLHTESYCGIVDVVYEKNDRKERGKMRCCKQESLLLESEDCRDF